MYSTVLPAAVAVRVVIPDVPPSFRVPVAPSPLAKDPLPERAVEIVSVPLLLVTVPGEVTVRVAIAIVPLKVAPAVDMVSAPVMLTVPAVLVMPALVIMSVLAPFKVPVPLRVTIPVRVLLPVLLSSVSVPFVIEVVVSTVKA